MIYLHHWGHTDDAERKKNAFFPANGVDRSEQLAVHNQFSTASNVSLLSGGYWIISQDNIS